MIEDDYGFSIQSILMLKNDKKQVLQEFVDESKVEKLIKNIFGYTKKESYSLYDKNSFLGRIKNIVDKPEYNSRWFSKEKPLVILAFLPCGIKGMGIYDISETLRKFIIKKHLLDDFEIVCMNSETNTDGKNPNKIIEEAEAKAKINGKSGVLVLTGKKCSLGITIKNCDIVLLLTNIDKYDTIFQMLYRCMTEDNNKRNGFVIDLNIQRCVNIIMDYAIKIGAGKSSKDSLKYILQQKLVEFNVDEWNDTIFGVRNTNIDNIITKVYNIFTSKSSNCIDKILENIDFKIELFSKEDQKLVKSLFNINKNKITKIKNLLENEDIDVPDGIEKIECKDGDYKESQNIKQNKIEEEIEEENIDIFNEIIKKLIPLLALITICFNDISSFDNMIKICKDNDELKPIILESIITWWGKKVEKEVFNIIIMLYDKYFKDNISFNNKVADIRDIFKHNLGNIKELSKSIDKFLIPHENEKKQNAEISTPYELRKDMLDKIPDDFWTTPKKVFEPCSGKCGFLIDIIDRFMDGLKDLIEDKEERYRIIIEECLYYSDINKTNIFIANLLLNPYGKYKLNYNEGDTLKLDIKAKWGIDGFDAVIGNPPYNNSQNNIGKKGGGDLLWNKFVEKSLIEWLVKNGYLLYVHPSGWRKPESDKSKYNGLFKLMTKNNQMIYLEIHNTNDGLKIFNCGTRYDWYLIKRTKKTEDTIIISENYIEYKINLEEWLFLPNCNFDIINKLLSKKNEECCNVIYNVSNYETRKKYVSDVKTSEYKYELIHSTPKSGVRYMYSSRNDLGHFGISKIIFGESGIYNSIIDIDGIYGMTQGAIGINIKNYNEYINIKEFIENKKFKKILESCSWSNFRIDWRLFTYFKKDFYKEFI
jgi:hypothetical protein